MRKGREKSVTGVYHVMLRGINKQDVFLDREDFRFMKKLLKEIQVRRNDKGELVERGLCVIYAYAILHNHLHLLIKEGKMKLPDLMKRLQDSYVIPYNRKYSRVGSLFQGRFRSEPVDTEEYFHVLLRYIHRNPVKAKEAERIEDYEFSSWCEYEGLSGDGICATIPVLKRYPLHELRAWVNDDADDKCMDIDNMKYRLSDDEAWLIIKKISKCSTVVDFKGLPMFRQFEILCTAFRQGVSKSQGARLSIIPLDKIKRLLKSASLQQK